MSGERMYKNGLKSVKKLQKSFNKALKERENKGIKEVTFSPSINRSASVQTLRDAKIKVDDRLYDHFKMWQVKQFQAQSDAFYQEKQICTFEPKIEPLYYKILIKSCQK
jgi:hypothetical protein